ncbi:MAG: PQQ-like beta-propeller repeat protein, partial [Verrucomicrobia bacterium]|nr:PQQ-like beta-propeller repeat protein [Verrucomicrobiota bacterium]
WSATVGPVFSDEFEPGPRSTPVVDGDRLYVQTALGEFRCLAMANGAIRWRFHFGDYGMRWVTDRASNVGAASRRGNTGSPVVDGDRILVQVGSTNGACLVAFDKHTGRELWKSQNDLASFSSPMIGTLAGRRQCVAVTCEGLMALDPADGALLWRIPFKTGANRNVLTPVLRDDTVYYASHTTGLRATRVRSGAPGPAAEDLWLNRDLRINLSSPVAVEGHLYGLGPARNFVCVDRATGAVAWSQPGFGDAASTVATADGQLLVLTDLGELLLLKASPEGYQEMGRRQVCGKTFSHPAYADGVLYVRDPRELIAWRL